VTHDTARVLEAQRGDEQAFTDLVEAYQAHVYNLCYRMLGTEEAAEDAAQETFLRAYQNLHRYDESRPFATWLLSIAAHYCIDRLRRRKFSMISIDDGEDGAPLELPDLNAPNPEREAERQEQHEVLQQALAHLSPVDRAAVIMRYWHDCSEVEIAQSLHLTVSAVKSRLHRARKELAGYWQELDRQTARKRRPYESPAF
jgi:RNA polymerase sigma-70 factor (ECF subfamily)